MKPRNETARRWLCTLLAASFLTAGLALPSAAQERKRKPVVVSFGQPNIWSLEQAHYLLARMHQENLDLRAASLAALNPNETNATRVTILKQLLEIGAEFDQGIAVQNERIVRNNEFNDTRRRQLITRRDSLSVEALGLSREIPNLEIERARMNANPSATAEARALKDTEIAKKKEELAAINQQVTTLNSEITNTSAPQGNLTAPTPSTTPFNSQRLPTGVLEGIAKNKIEQALTGEGNDPKLNATTMLDNHVQMQYEIIAKQLTLLRDEVGPGERLVFLELPQSVYTTPGPGDEKMAQAWWHVNGYTRTDPLLRLLLELYQVEQKWRQIKEVDAFEGFADENTPDGAACRLYADEVKRRNEDEAKPGHVGDALSRPRVLRETFYEFKCEYENARARLFRDLFREARSDFARAQQGGARETSELVQAIREAVRVTPASPSAKRVKEREEDAAGEVRGHVEGRQLGPTAEEAAGARDTMRNQLLCILSDPNLRLEDDSRDPNPKLVTEKRCGNPEKFDFKKGIEYVRVDGRADRPADGAVRPDEIELHTVRTVDIIPRQSSLNVNDIQETVKATGILAAFKFLFGFAGQVNFQRQREQFEQFVHQELYASGFGKGSRDFGWTFGALPGTKRVAPGVRTTYAALVVPDDAESLVLSARGCYFPRKSYEPLDFEDTGHRDWDRESKFRSYNCGDEQTYIIPIPSGGNRSDFWVTAVDYAHNPGAGPGDRATVSIRGKNFSTQMGVLVNGTPMRQTVGLAQPLLSARAGTVNTANGGVNPATTLPNCAKATEVCGYLERIDPEQVVFSFTMPNDSQGNPYKGIPTITLIAPGKSVDINWLPNLTINGVRNKMLREGENNRPDFIFGARPPEAKATLSITDFKVFSVNPNNRQGFAILTGTEFTAADEVFVNGESLPEGELVLPPAPPRRRGRQPAPVQRTEFKQFKSKNLYRLVFDIPPGDEVIVTVARPGLSPVSRTFPNPLRERPNN
jgi:hypothetical protein